MYNILICDDEKDIVSALEIYLHADGYETFSAANGSEALEILSREEIHLVLMDIMMPIMDGLTATSHLREKYNVPVILLTAKGEDADKVLGLNIGADDYVTKPFHPAELSARVRSQLRRYTTLGGARQEDEIRLGGIVLSARSRAVTLDGDPLSLTPTEYGNPRHGHVPQGDLSPGVERFALRGGKHRGGAHPPSAGKDRD